jgi:hypothetical protein
MMAPEVYRDARMAAKYHILGRIVERRPGSIDVRVTRVLRGKLDVKLWFGPTLTLQVHESHPAADLTPPGGTIYVDPGHLDRAAYVEAFLDGDPPDVVLDQIKFFSGKQRRPTGDPSIAGFLW